MTSNGTLAFKCTIVRDGQVCFWSLSRRSTRLILDRPESWRIKFTITFVAIRIYILIDFNPSYGNKESYQYAICRPNSELSTVYNNI